MTDAETHPLVRFWATEVRPLRQGAASGSRAGRWEASGTLTFHGQTHLINTTVDVWVAGDSVRARAQFPVSLTRFDVDRPRLMWIPSGDTIRIDAQVVGHIDTTAAQRVPLRSSRSGTGRP